MRFVAGIVWLTSFFLNFTVTAQTRECVAGLPLGSFQLTAELPGNKVVRPLRDLVAVQEGYRLRYNPIRLPEATREDGKVALILAPASGVNAPVTVLDPKPADKANEWIAPFRSSVVAVVFGPRGLSTRKVRSLIKKDQELVLQLADYAEQTAQVESLIETLTAAEASGASLDAALTGFASRNGISTTKLDRNAPTNQQAMVLMQALNPALATYDPLAPQAVMVQQSMGLAASVAALFFGEPVGLAVGGAAMANNLRTMLFPGTEFRSVLAQSTTSGLSLCANRRATRSRTRIAYLWATRFPNAALPSLSIPSAAHLPLRLKSNVTVHSEARTEWRYLDRAHTWTLTNTGTGGSFPVKVKPVALNQLEFDLTDSSIPPGVYKLSGTWDWDPFEVQGEIHLHPLSDLKQASIAPESQDRLIHGSGVLTINLTGPDFQFVESAAIRKIGRLSDPPTPVKFALPTGPRAGTQTTLMAAIDTGALLTGEYRLVLTQSGGSTYELPLVILPTNPRLENLPLRANTGESEQSLLLRGQGLDRVKRIYIDGGEVNLLAAGSSRLEAVIRLPNWAKPGDQLPLRLVVDGLNAPLIIPGAVHVAGPRPQIESATASLPGELSVALRPGEVPAGSFASYSIRVRNTESRPTLRLNCAEPDRAIQQQQLRPGEKTPSARLEGAGDSVLFLSFDPGAVGQTGCNLAAIVETESAGASDPYPLGRVVRLPRIDAFRLTEEKAGDTSYVALLTGVELETIERAGWDATHGLPVEELPSPLAGEAHRQSLKITLPWPPPAPRAPLYVWLRGEKEGRETSARY